jgi:hypothetical protein
VIDATTIPEQIQQLQEVGVDIEEGMLVRVWDALYVWEDAVSHLKILLEPQHILDRFFLYLSSNNGLVLFAYPLFKLARQLQYIFRRRKSPFAEKK